VYGQRGRFALFGEQVQDVGAVAGQQRAGHNRRGRGDARRAVGIGAADQAVGGQRDPGVFIRNLQVAGGNIACQPAHDHRAPGIAVAGLDLLQLTGDGRSHQLGAGQELFQVLDELELLFVLVLDLLTLQRGQAAKLHIQDGLGLNLAEVERLAEVAARRLNRARAADDVDRLIQVIQGGEQPFQDVGALAGARQIVFAAPPDYRQAMIEVDTQRLLETERAWLAINQGQHDDAEGGLQRCELEQLGQNLRRIGGAAQFYYHAQALAIGFVAEVTHAFHFARLRQFGDALDQVDLVDLKGQFGDDDPAAAPTHVLQMHLSPHGDLAPANGIGGL